MSLDEVQVDIRRRLWHQISYLELLAAEANGMEPTIPDDHLTARFPRHVDDADLVEGRFIRPNSTPSDRRHWTENSPIISRFGSARCLRKTLKNMFLFNRRYNLSEGGYADQDGAFEKLQLIFEETVSMIQETRASFQELFLSQIQPNVPLQRIVQKYFESLKKKCWVMFWCGLPQELKSYKATDEVRTKTFLHALALVELFNQCSSDEGMRQFRWHINGHNCFQAIMYLLDELRDRDFWNGMDVGIRMNTLSALKTADRVKGHRNSNIWTAIHGMMDQLGANDEADLEVEAMDTTISQAGLDEMPCLDTNWAFRVFDPLHFGG